jgi:hypothetical protein
MTSMLTRCVRLVLLSTLSLSLSHLHLVVETYQNDNICFFFFALSLSRFADRECPFLLCLDRSGREGERRHRTRDRVRIDRRSKTIISCRKEGQKQQEQTHRCAPQNSPRSILENWQRLEGEWTLSVSQEKPM